MGLSLILKAPYPSVQLRLAGVVAWCSLPFGHDFIPCELPISLITEQEREYSGQQKSRLEEFLVFKFKENIIRGLNLIYPSLLDFSLLLLEVRQKCKADQKMKSVLQ
jgi:hypothetical protein